MTPEQKAEQILSSLNLKEAGDRVNPSILKMMIAKAISSAVKNERRACAKIASIEAWEAYNNSKPPDATKIEKAIRARK